MAPPIADAIRVLLEHWDPPVALSPHAADDEDLDDVEVCGRTDPCFCTNCKADQWKRYRHCSVTVSQEYPRFCQQPTRFKVVRWTVAAMSWGPDDPAGEKPSEQGFETACTKEHARQLIDEHRAYAKGALGDIHYEIRAWKYEPHWSLRELPEPLAMAGDALDYALSNVREIGNKHARGDREDRFDREYARRHLARAVKYLAEFERAGAVG